MSQADTALHLTTEHVKALEQVDDTLQAIDKFVLENFGFPDLQTGPYFDATAHEDERILQWFYARVDDPSSRSNAGPFVVLECYLHSTRDPTWTVTTGRSTNHMRSRPRPDPNRNSNLSNVNLTQGTFEMARAAAHQQFALFDLQL